MNFEDYILEIDKKIVDKEYIDDTYIESIDNLFLVIETENLTFSPCCFLGEDETWVFVLVLTSQNTTQCSAIKKDSIISFGFINTGVENLSEEEMQVDSEILYQ